jgi:agmatinase
MAHVARTFLDQPLVAPDRAQTGAIAILGAGHGSPYPATADVAYDTATASADAPQAIRDAVNQSSSNIDHVDFDLGGPLLGNGARTLVDCGDLRLVPTDGPANRAAIEAATRAIIGCGAIPVLLGGDDSVPIPFHTAFGGAGPVDVVQIDAHIDWRDSLGGEHFGYSSTMRRAADHAFVRSITQIGARGVGSARAAEYDAARAWGARIITMQEARVMGAAAVVDAVPHDGRVVIAVDLDALDPSICPAVNAPTPGGFRFEELADLLRTMIAERRVVGLSVVELVPSRDPFGLSALVAGRLVCNAIGAMARASP